LVAPVRFDLGVETLNAPGVQILVCTIFLLRVCTNGKPSGLIAGIVKMIIQGWEPPYLEP
jgi:hypothetical protein